MRIRTSFWAPAILGRVADLLSKHYVFALLQQAPGGRRPLLGPWLVLQLQRNTGGVFGFLPGKGYVFVALTIVALGFVVWMVRKSRPEQWLLRLALGLVTAGALGNLVDRLWFGFVRDFIYVEVINWPAFNIADSCICVAATILFLEILREGREEREGESSPSE